MKVKDKYKDVDDYISTYEPLIFEEAKSQIIRGIEEEEEQGIFLLLLTILTVLIILSFVYFLLYGIEVF